MKQQPDYSMKKLGSMDFHREEYVSADRENLNFFDSDFAQNPLKAIWSNPIGKGVIVAGGAVIMIFGSGYLLRLLAWWKEGYRQYRDAGTGSNTAPPKG